MRRICFLLRVHPDRVAEYRRLHAAVPQRLRDDLAAAGWHNYSIFVTDAGELIGYLETEDFALAVERMQGSEANAEWQRAMMPLFADLADSAPDTCMRPIPEAFHLD